ncbi:MAG: 50S ribosomal protein L21 [Candidatus Shikimatogenerans bostrichidophilus]|nr:MAG: 50S ribosomal protein L21 [Candidatus Shikimatogenerans bostrichidophilus]
MYKEAIIKLGNHQYLVSPNKFIYIYRLNHEKNKEIIFKENILLIIDNNNNIIIGKPLINNFIINAIIINNIKDNKIIIFKKKRRKGYNIKKGHRQQITKLKIISIKKIKNKKYGT